MREDATREHGVFHDWEPPRSGTSAAPRDYAMEAMLDVVLGRLRDQLARYQSLARKERDETGCETHGTCAYLDGAVVASRRAVEIVSGLQDNRD